MAIGAFTYDALPGRLVFGSGRFATTAAEVRRLGSRAVLVHGASGRALAQRLAADLGPGCAGTFDGVRQHVPAEGVRRCREVVVSAGADVLVSVGGGSSTGFAKAVALETGLPIVAVATTYAGSEMTPIWGRTEAGRKTTGRDLRVLPRTVVHDPELTLGMPAQLTAASGLNALAHAVEALYAPGANPVTTTIAAESIRALTAGLPAAVADGQDLGAREDCLYGAALAGSTLAVAGTSVHHKTCHVLGGRFDLPHAGTHAVLLPHAVAAVADRFPHAMQALARGLGASDGVEGLFALQASLGAPTSLRDVGLHVDDLDEAVAGTMAVLELAALGIDDTRVRRMLDDAFSGRRP